MLTNQRIAVVHASGSSTQHACPSLGKTTSSDVGSARAAPRRPRSVSGRRLHRGAAGSARRSSRALAASRFRRRCNPPIHPQTRTRLDPRHQALVNPRAVAYRAVRLHRRLLQPPTHPTTTRPSKPRRLRTTHSRLNTVSTKAGQLQRVGRAPNGRYALVVSGGLGDSN